MILLKSFQNFSDILPSYGVCVCVYVPSLVWRHTHTHTLKIGQLHLKKFCKLLTMSNEYLFSN